MTDWIFQGNGKQLDLDAAITASRLRSWRTPRYRDRAAAGDRVWLQVVGRHEPGIYYVAAITAPPAITIGTITRALASRPWWCRCMWLRRCPLLPLASTLEVVSQLAQRSVAAVGVEAGVGMHGM